MKRLILTLMAAAGSWAQQPTPAPDAESQQLREALAEAGNSPVDFLRALERHLEKFPQSKQRSDVERGIVRAALELKDNRRIIQYGELVLAREPNDLQLLDRVTRALLSDDSEASAKRALPYAQRFETGVRDLEKKQPPAGRDRAKMREELDRGLGRAFVYQARAQGNLGHVDQAVALSTKSYETYPTAESAREIARWLMKQGKTDQAIARYADAFTISDARNTEAERARDRQRMGELFKQQHSSEAGLGDLILQAYDRTSALQTKRREELEKLDPNSERGNPLDYTLSGPSGESIALSTLKGKVLIMDFWATWCGPCRVQHPLYEKVKERFRANPNVVFLAVNADEERSVVKPFLTEQGWTHPVYFDDGLSNLLQVSSLPTTVIFNRKGEVTSRMNGFVPDRFVDMLSDRITEALR